MIVDHALNENEQKTAQRIFQKCEALNAAGGACCSQTILVLLALSINIKDIWVSGIGSLTYFSYLFLPCGFYFAARMGACSSIRLMKFSEGAMCLLVMCSALWLHDIWQFILFFAGTLLLYFFQSCGSAMFFPLQKNISNEKTLTAMIVRNQNTAMAVGMVFSLLIAWLLKLKPECLPFFMAAAFVIFVFYGMNIAVIPEPPVLKQMASQPLLKQVLLAFRNELMRKQLATGCILNLILAMILPINILAAKIGFGLNDSSVLILSIIQILAQIMTSQLYKLLAAKIGPRNIMVITYPLIWIFVIYWLLIPAKASFALAVIPFILSGMITIFFSTALANYFIISIPNRIQVGGTFLVFVVTGGVMGAIGILLNPLILSGIKSFCSSGGMRIYQIYFLITGLLFALGIISPLRLPVKYKEYRKKHSS